MGQVDTLLEIVRKQAAMLRRVEIRLELDEMHREWEGLQFALQHIGGPVEVFVGGSPSDKERERLTRQTKEQHAESVANMHHKLAEMRERRKALQDELESLGGRSWTP